MLASYQSLNSLDLRSNNIGIDGGCAIFKALGDNSSLTELDLGILAGGSRNRVGLKVVICCMLHAFASTLQTVIIRTVFNLKENLSAPALQRFSVFHAQNTKFLIHI